MPDTTPASHIPAIASNTGLVSAEGIHYIDINFSIGLLITQHREAIMTRTSPQARLTAAMWEDITLIYDAILAHPFVKGLTGGDLSRDAFLYYIVQDSLYLREYARALAMLAVKAPDEQTVMLFCEHAKGCIQVERALHASFFKDSGITDEIIDTTPMAPACQAYTSYLLSTAYGRPYHEALAAVLPCYWIYWEVGKALIAQGSPDPLYRRWIETYADESFGGLVNAVLVLTDQIAVRLNREDHEIMRRHFVTTSRYEWMFWDMGYRQEQWPV